MNRTSIAQKSVICLSLLYFLPISYLIPGSVNLQPGTFPALTYLQYILVVAALFLSVAGGYLYARTCRQKYLIPAVGNLFFAILLLLLVPMFGMTPYGISGALTIYLYFLYPVNLILLIPAWFAIPGVKTPHHIPQILALITTLMAVGSFFVLLIFQGSLTPGELNSLFAVWMTALTITGILSGLILIHRGLHHPEVAEPVSSSSVLT